jgi:hypothetical protein
MSTKKKTLERTPRLRYVEPPTKKDGNPFFAFRCESGLLRAFKAHARKKKIPPTSLVRALMAVAAKYDHSESDGGAE